MLGSLSLIPGRQNYKWKIKINIDPRGKYLPGGTWGLKSDPDNDLNR